MKKYTIEDMLKTVVYTGIGVATTATEKLQKTIDDMVEKGKIPAEEGRKIVDEFVDNSEDRREDMEKRVKGVVKSIVDRFDFPTKKDYEALAKRIEKLEKAARASKATKATRSTKPTAATAAKATATARKAAAKPAAKKVDGPASN